MITSKTDLSNNKHEELEELVSSNSYLTTWRVYFNQKELEELRETYTITENKVVKTVDSTTDADGNVVEYETTEVIPVQKIVTSHVYQSQYVEIELPKSQTPTALEIVKELMIDEIEEYDTSENVNNFVLNGMNVWLDKATRVGLMNSTTIEKNLGKTETTLWLGNIPITVNCDLAIQLLGGIENYALECFNVTAAHKKQVEEMTSVDEVVNFDYTADYPQQLIVNTEGE